MAALVAPELTVFEAHSAVVPSRSTRLPSPCRFSENRPSHDSTDWFAASDWLAVSSPQVVGGGVPAPQPEAAGVPAGIAPGTPLQNGSGVCTRTADAHTPPAA